MAEWTTPKTWDVDELVTAALLNVHLRDNLLALKQPPQGEVKRDNGGFYSTTSTSFVAIDNTNLKKTVTTAGGKVKVFFQGTIHADSATSRRVYLDVQVDGSGGVGQDAGFAGGLVVTAVQSTVGQTVVVGPVILDGLAAGAHTFALMWKTNAGTMYLHADTSDVADENEVPAIFWVEEG